jgi:predicted lipoprotein
MLAWEGLAAVPAGAVLERRAVRTLDFWPTRPPQLLALMQLAHTADKAALGAAVRAAGAAVKGLPALEWLLWRQWDAPGARTLAAQLASELSLEAGALLQDYSEGKRNAEAEDPDEAKAWTDYGEWFGQCMGSMEQLRLKKMRTNTRGKDTAVWVRGVSKQTSAAWQAHWGGIAQFLSTINAHGCGDARANTYRFTTLLRSRGHLEAATRLEEQMAATARAVHAARPEDAISVQRAQNALAALQARASDMGSRYFDFSQGFTDADGD